MTIQEMKTEKVYPETIESRELCLFAMNDSTTYFNSILPNYKNIARKANKGTYIPEKAHKAFYNVACYAAQRYCANFGGTWHKVFSVSDRKAAADYLLEDFIENYTSNNIF